MSSLYPSLEDMQVHKIVQAQQNTFANQMNTPQPMSTQNSVYPSPSAPSEYDIIAHTPASNTLYPGLTNFMGLELTQEMIALNMPEYMPSNQIERLPASGGMIAPLSSQTVGLQRAQVTHGIREVIVCKDAEKKIGLRVKDINNGVFITLVCKDSPAALVG